MGVYAPDGIWQAWSPSYSNITVGNGTVTARYARMANTIVGFYKIILGSTSAIGTNPTFSAPVTAASHYGTGVNMVGYGYAEDSGVAGYNIIYSFNASTANIQGYVSNAAGTYANNSSGVTATAPFTWGTNDYFNAMFTYEAA